MRSKKEVFIFDLSRDFHMIGHFQYQCKCGHALESSYGGFTITAGKQKSLMKIKPCPACIKAARIGEDT